MVRSFFLLACSTVAIPATAATIDLSQKDVAELILRQGPAAQEVAFKYEQLYLPYLQEVSILDWRVNLETGFMKSKSESLTTQGDFTNEQYRTIATVEKSLLTGTELKLTTSRTSQKTSVVSPNILPQVNEDYVGLELQQALWGNSFGWGYRARVRQADYAYQSTVGLRANELEDVVLGGLRQFWNTYVSQESFRSAMAARDRYERLVSAVRRKTSLGYANPGELSQVQAEFEGQVQSVKRASTDYLRNLDSLITALSLTPGTEINFSVSRQIPPVPKLASLPVDDLRAVKAQEFKTKAAEEALSVAKSNEKPLVNLVARASTSGVDEASSAAYAEMTSMNKPAYYAGLRFSYKFGSGVLDADIRAKRAALSLEETRLKLAKSQQRDQAADAERRVGAAYAIAQSAMKTQEFREKAVNELNRTYNQGRTDIRTLIDNMNQLFNAEVASIRALGDYQIALNEWAALRDELIPDQPKEENK